MRYRLARLAVAASAALVVIFVGTWLVAHYRLAPFAYGWDVLGPPDRISYCGRDYLPGSHRSLAQIESRPDPYSFRQVGLTATGKAIFAQPLPDAVRQGTPYSGPLPCDMAVYLKTGSDDYIAYGISGGP